MADAMGLEPLAPRTPSGWYPDPAGAKAARYWDGLEWTSNARDDIEPKAPPSADELRDAAENLTARRAGQTRWQRVIVTTSHELPQAVLAEHLGEVFGVTVRTRNMFSNAVAGVRGVVGGEVGSYTKLMVTARQESLDRLRQEADALGANAIISMRLDANQISSDMTEFIAYGAAVRVEWQPTEQD
jgi:uncharacterized protein YbjQ (UPF0145 family)